MDFKNIILKVFSSGGSISKKTAQGTLWIFFFRLVDQLFRLARTVILARLLAPNDFGLFGITVMAVSLLESFSQNGFHDALVQKKGDIKPYLDTSWVVQIIRGFVLASILFFLAPFIAVFFKAPEAEQILKVVGFATLLSGLGNVAVVFLSKELEFHKYFLYQIMGTLADFAVAVVFAIILRNVWALVFGLLAGILVKVIISYTIYSYYPRFKFDFEKTKELFNFGKWISVSNAIAFFVVQADSFFVAKMLGISALGFYQIAYKIPSVLAIEVLAGAIFPAYSKIQDNLAKIKESYLKILQLFSFLIIPMAGGIFVLSSEFIVLFLGEKWLPAVGAMQVLILSTPIWTVAFLSDYVFLALGKPKIVTKGITIRLVLLVTFIYPLIMWKGILGSAIAVLIGVLFSTAWFIFMLMKTIDCRFNDFFKNIIAPLINTTIMALVISVLKNEMPVKMWSFFYLIVVGILIYFALTYISDKFSKNKIIPLIKDSFNLILK